MSLVRIAELTAEELERGLGEVREAPKDEGALELIVVRPGIEEREILEEGILDAELGLIGDIWPIRASSATGAPKPDAQITLMNARATALVADSSEPGDWAQAGDQLYVDLDVGEENLPPGTRLEIGDALLEITAEPHLGCGKFIRRFGVDAMKLVNSDIGRELRLRGVYARVVQPGAIARKDVVRKV